MVQAQASKLQYILVLEHKRRRFSEAYSFSFLLSLFPIALKTHSLRKKRTTCLIQWCENPPTLSSSCGGGSVVEVGSLKANVAGPSDSKHSILLVADIFGDYPLNHSSNPHDSCFYFILHIT